MSVAVVIVSGQLCLYGEVLEFVVVYLGRRIRWQSLQGTD
jgi:hypothetical protein